MTTDIKINEILKNVKGFKGVFLYDELKHQPPLIDGVLVVNYVTRTEADQGIIGHFVVIDNRKHLVKDVNWTGCLYFDPYGLPPDVPRDLLGLPNTKNITNYLNEIRRLGDKVKINTIDFQVEQPWDVLCGVFSILYIENPNYDTNPSLQLKQARIPLDHKLMHMFTESKLLGNPYQLLNINKTTNDIRRDSISL